jgi:hypothetical protein
MLLTEVRDARDNGPKSGLDLRRIRLHRQLDNEFAIILYRKPGFFYGFGMRRLAVWISTGLGVGYMPFGPGTFGTLWGVLIFYLARQVPWQIFAGGTLLFILFAVYCAELTERAWGSHDSGSIVIDEWSVIWSG